MKKILVFLISMMLMLSLITKVSLAYNFISTNDDNRTNGKPHVNLVSNVPGSVTLDFVNNTNSLAFFEYRIDGVLKDSGNEHPVVTGDYIYSGVSVDSIDIAEPVIITKNFEATQKVEVRLALGGERDWDFDWITFEVQEKVPENPESSDVGLLYYILTAFSTVGGLILAKKLYKCFHPFNN